MKDQQGWKAAKQELAFVDKLTEEEKSEIKEQIKDFALAGISREELHEYIDEIYNEMGDKA